MNLASKLSLYNLTPLPLTLSVQAGLLKRQLCVALNDSRIQPVRWTWKVKDKVNLGEKQLGQSRAC